jgi:hypothetical protein
MIEAILRNKIFLLVFFLINSPVILYLLNINNLVLFLFENIWIFFIFIALILLLISSINNSKIVFYSVYERLSVIFGEAIKFTLAISFTFLFYGIVSNSINDNSIIIKEDITFDVKKNKYQKHGYYYLYKNSEFIFTLNSDDVIYVGTLVHKKLFFGTVKSIFLCRKTNEKLKDCKDLGLNRIDKIKIK